MIKNAREVSMNTIRSAKVMQEFCEKMMAHIKNTKRVSATVVEEVLELLLKTNQGNIDLIEALLADNDSTLSET